MPAEHEPRRRLPLQHLRPDGLFAGARAFDDSPRLASLEPDRPLLVAEDAVPAERPPRAELLRPEPECPLGCPRRPPRLLDRRDRAHAHASSSRSAAALNAASASVQNPSR